MQSYFNFCVSLLCIVPRVFTKVLKPAVELLRSIGIRLVIYMDNMLLMANSKQLIREQTYTSVSSGEPRICHHQQKKSVLTSCQQMEFFRMTVDSQSMVIKLPGEKIKKIRAEAQHLLANLSIQARSLAQFLGKLNATSPALQMASLFCYSLQISIRGFLAANSQDYQSPVKLSPQAVEDLQWWEKHLTSWNGRSFIFQLQ